jgi:hypothetical protein
VLATTKEVTLDVDSHDACVPEARLFNRVCTQAPAGLQVNLHLPSETGALPTLFQPGAEAGGWRNVHGLKPVQVQFLLSYLAEY